MFLRTIRTLILLVLTLPQLALATAGDWTGRFDVEMNNHSIETVTHTPSKVQFMFFSVGSCLFLGKGVRLNGVTIPEDVNLCTKASVDEFSAEVAKLGRIIRRSLG